MSEAPEGLDRDSSEEAHHREAVQTTEAASELQTQCRTQEVATQ